MSRRVEEITQELDRKSGRRIIRVTTLAGGNRAVIEIQAEEDRSLQMEEPSYEARAQPMHNGLLSELLLDLVCELRAKPHTTTL